jgi:hypothetical protein
MAPLLAAKTGHIGRQLGARIMLIIAQHKPDMARLAR